MICFGNEPFPSRSTSNLVIDVIQSLAKSLPSHGGKSTDYSVSSDITLKFDNVILVEHVSLDIALFQYSTFDVNYYLLHTATITSAI